MPSYPSMQKRRLSLLPLRAFLLGAAFLIATASGDRLRAQVAASSAASQPSVGDAVLSVEGDVPTALKLSSADLAKLPQQEARLKDRAGTEAVYAGPTLAAVLQAAGMKFDPGAMPAKGAVASYVLVEAKDGYKALFALAEIDPTLASQAILLAVTKDGQPLSALEGPWRVIVPSDKRPARSVRQVIAIVVHGG